MNDAASESAPDRLMAELHLRLLAPGAQPFTFQTYTDSRDRRDEYKAGGRRDPLARIFHGTLAQFWDGLVKFSAEGAGIYVTINETNFRGRSAADIVRVRFYFSDLDGAPLDNLLRVGLRPHFVTHTSPKRFHTYWRIDGASLERFKASQQRLARLLEGDAAVCDLPRVLRLAGFPNQKNGAHLFLVTIAPVPSAPSSPYSDAEFQAALADAEKHHAHLRKPTGQRGLAERSVASLPPGPPDMRQGYPDGQRTSELTRRVGWCLGPQNMTEAEAIAACLEWNQYNSPPLSEQKIRSTVASIAKSEAKKRASESEDLSAQSKADSEREKCADDAQQSNNNSQHAGRTDESAQDATQREKLIAIGLDAELWHDKDGTAFATIQVRDHHETFAVKSTSFRHWLTRAYGERYPMKIGGKTCPSAPSTQALNEAINALSAKAAAGVEHQAAVRIGEHGGSIFVDLGTAEWSVVEITPAGWHVAPSAPVRFIRPAGLRPLPIPVKGGNIQNLARFLNITSGSDFVLVVSWLVAALRPTGPYAVLILNGEQGAGKSVTCRVLRRLIDPNAAELRNDTRDERDLLLAAKNGWIVALDNLSYVRNDLSDAICRIATKGAFATRALYTNDEEFLLEVCRPVLLNGIPPLASRVDLADRAIVCVLPHMAESRRRPEQEFWSDFEIAAPRILGTLLDAVSGAMRRHAEIVLSNPCRMMDFAKWSEAGCRALGCNAGAFEAAYMLNRSASNEDALDADRLAGAVVELMDAEQAFSGTATALLAKLEERVPWTQRGKQWPKDATRLSGHLRRLVPLLRPRGIEIDFDKRSPDAARKRLIEIKKVGAG